MDFSHSAVMNFVNQSQTICQSALKIKSEQNFAKVNDEAVYGQPELRIDCNCCFLARAKLIHT